ncbi:MAG TPA: hypothetical protein VG265_14075 [Gaiellaceae bacterium]|jgi:hypothetical protein|nr:hypothetical protein [Gaiellaceae bacterium]
MDEPETVAERVLERLRRIRALRGEAAPSVLIGELRELVVEAQEWARLEGDDRACSAAAQLEEEMERIEEVVHSVAFR